MSRNTALYMRWCIRSCSRSCTRCNKKRPSLTERPQLLYPENKSREDLQDPPGTKCVSLTGIKLAQRVTRLSSPLFYRFFSKISS